MLHFKSFSEGLKQANVTNGSWSEPSSLVNAGHKLNLSFLMRIGQNGGMTSIIASNLSGNLFLVPAMYRIVECSI
jgi:hypothetical protein